MRTFQWKSVVNLFMVWIRNMQCSFECWVHSRGSHVLRMFYLICSSSFSLCPSILPLCCVIKRCNLLSSGVHEHVRETMNLFQVQLVKKINKWSIYSCVCTCLCWWVCDRRVGGNAIAFAPHAIMWACLKCNRCIVVCAPRNCFGWTQTAGHGPIFNQDYLSLELQTL